MIFYDEGRKMKKIKRLLSGFTVATFLAPFALGTPVLANEPFTRSYDQLGNAISVVVDQDGIANMAWNNARAPFDLLRVSVTSTSIGLEIALPDGNQFVPIDIENLRIAGRHGQDGLDPFSRPEAWEESWEEAWMASLFYFVVADTTFTTTINDAGNLYVSIDVPAGYINLDELFILGISPFLDIDNIDFEAIDWQINVATHFGGLDQIRGFGFATSWYNRDDFDRTIDYVHYRAFGSGNSHLIDLLQPIGQTFIYDDIILEAISTVAITTPNSSWIEIQTLVSLTVPGIEILQDNFGSVEAVLVSGADSNITMFESGVPRTDQTHHLLYFDRNTDTFYFLARTNVSFWDWGMDDIVTPDNISFNLEFTQFVSNRETSDITVDIDWLEIISTHDATFVSRTDLEEGFEIIGWGMSHEPFYDVFGNVDWNEVDKIFDSLDIPRPGELAIDLGYDFVLSNIAILDDMLWIQIKAPHQNFMDIVDAQAFLNFFNTHWENPPHNIFRTIHTQIGENFEHVGDAIRTYVFSIDHLSDVENLTAFISHSMYTLFRDIDFNVSVNANVIEIGFFVEENHSIQVAGYDFYIANINVSSSSIDFNILSNDGMTFEELLDNLDIDLEPSFIGGRGARDPIGELFDIRLVTADGISEPKEFDWVTFWSPVSVVGPVASGSFNASFIMEMPPVEIIFHTRFYENINPLEVIGLVINGTHIQ